MADKIRIMIDNRGDNKVLHALQKLLLAILDLAWPNGLQEGLSEPVTLLIGEGKEIEEIVNRAGYLYFTSVEAFREYVEKEVLALETTDTQSMF